MDKLDLNIENYELNDLLNLFKIPQNFTENDLKQAKKMVLKTHPDKSGLNPDYFRFFSKAYKIVYGMWEFKNKATKNNDKNVSTDYYSTSEYFNREKKELLNNFLENKKKSGDFNEWFNKEFEKNKLEREDDIQGYGNWLKSDEDLEEEKHISSLTQMGEEIERKKQQIRALTVYKGVEETNFYSSGGSNLTGDAPENFTSDLFSSLQYEDLRKAHTETVIPVTMDDYNNVQKFKNVNEYKDYRNNQNIVPLSELQAREYLSNKEKYQEKESTVRAYKLAKQFEDSQKKQEDYWASIRYINNK